MLACIVKKIFKILNPLHWNVHNIEGLRNVNINWKKKFIMMGIIKSFILNNTNINHLKIQIYQFKFVHLFVILLSKVWPLLKLRKRWRSYILIFRSIQKNKKHCSIWTKGEGEGLLFSFTLTPPWILFIPMHISYDTIFCFSLHRIEPRSFPVISLLQR